MNENDLLRRIAITKAKPDTVTDLQPRELAELVLVVLNYAKEIKQQIEEGKIKGDPGEDGKDGAEFIPQPDVDYLSLPTAKRELESFKSEVVSKVLSDVQNAILSLENGKDGLDGHPGKDGADGKDGKDGINGLNGLDAVVTEADIKQAADLAFKMIELPDFRKYITEQPEAIRDSLELLQGDDRLDASAIKNLDKYFKTSKPDMMVGGIRFLSQLADVRTTSLANGDVLKWNSTTNQWENGADASGGTPGGSDTHIQFNQSGAFSGEANLVWDYTNNRLGVNTTSPKAVITSVGAYTVGSNIPSTWAGIFAGRAGITKGDDSFYFDIFTSGYTGAEFSTYNYNTSTPFPMIFQANGGNLGIGTTATNPGSMLSVNAGASIGSGYYGTAAPTNGAIIEGNVGIGISNPSEKLAVFGTASIIDSGTGFKALFSTSLLGANRTYSFPNQTGTLALTSDIPVIGGSDTQVQFNDGGVFGGDSAFVWDKTISQLTIGLPSDLGAGNAQAPLVITGNDNNYYATSIQNLNAGDSASSDYLVSADNDGTAIAGHYGDFGINSSGYVGSNIGIIKTVSIHTAGTGYTAGDIVDITGGDSNGQIEILTVNGSGAALTIAIHDNGTSYTVTNFATTGGTGSGFRVNVLTLYDYTGFLANDVYLTAAGGNLVIGTDDTGPNSALKFFSNGFATTNERMRIDENLSVYSNLGAEKVPALTGASGVNWTVGAGTNGWTMPLAGTIIKSADGTATLTPTGTFSISTGTTYKVVITVSAWSVGSCTWTLGGVRGQTLSAATTYTNYITAGATGKIIFTPTNTSRFTISSISVKALTDNQGDLLVHGNITSYSPAAFHGPITMVGSNAMGQSLYGTNWFMGGAGGTFNHTTGPLVGIGANALSSASAGASNVAVGGNALGQGLTGNDNLAFGAYALWQSVGVANNCAFGSSALVLLNSGVGNTAFGREALQGNYSTHYGVAIGYQAGYNFGKQAEALGSQNNQLVLIGQSAGWDLTTGFWNTMVGANTGRGVTTGAYNTILGANVTALPAGTASNIILAIGTGAIKAQYVLSTDLWTMTGSMYVGTNLELGHATDTTLSRSSAGVLAVEGVVVPTISSTNTLTNKRITKRTLVTNAPGATPTTATDSYDMVLFTGLATAITSMTTNLTGTPTEGQTLWIAFTDNGTARAITWGSSFEASTVALPTTTVISTRLDVGFVWNTVTSKWRCIASC